MKKIISMHNIVKMFPEIFEINLEEKKWYNTLGLCEEVEIDKVDIIKAAIKHASRTIDNPLEHVDAINEIIEHFNTINKMLKEKMYSEMANEIFKCIPMKMEEFYEKFEKQCLDNLVKNSEGMHR